MHKAFSLLSVRIQRKPGLFFGYLVCLCVCLFLEYCDILVFASEASCVKNELTIVVRHLLFAISSRSSYALKDLGPNSIADVI